MGDVDLGAIKAKLELDAAALDRGVQEASEALKRLGASSEQTAAYLEQMMRVPAEYRDAFNAVLLSEANAVENLGETVQKTKGFFDGFAESFTKGVTFGGAFEIGRKSADLLLGGIKDLGAGIVELVQRGSDVAKISGSFEALSASVGQSSTEILKAAQEGSRGLITNYDLMASANKAMLLGLPVTAKEMGILAKSAEGLGRAMGQDATKSLNDLIVGLGRGSPKILDNIGIVVKAKDAYEAYAKAHDTTTSAMSQAEKTVAVYNAALASAEARVRSLGETTLTAAEKIEQLNVVATNFKDEVALIVQGALADMISQLGFWGDSFQGPANLARDMLNAMANGFVNMASIAGNAMQALIGAFETTIRTMAAQASELKKILTFQETPFQGLVNIGKQSAAGLQGVVASLSEAFKPELTFKEYFRAPRTMGAKAPGPPPPESTGIPKELQSEMDRLSGAKAQQEMDRITAAVKNLGIEGVSNVDALGKRLVQLGTDGAKVPDQLMGTWTDAFIKQASKVGSQGESLKKQIAGIYKENSKTISDTLKRDEEAARQYEKTRVFIDKEAEDQIRAQLRDGTLSVKEQYDLRRSEIIASTTTQIDQIKRLVAVTTDPSQLAALQALMAEWERIADRELRATVAAERYAQVTTKFSALGDILAGVSDVFDAIGISADSAVGKIVSGMQEAVSAVQNFTAQTTTAGRIGAGLSAAASVYKTGQEKGAMAGVTSGALTGAGIGFAVGGPAGAAVGAVAGIVTGLIGSLRKPEYKKIMSDVGKSWGVNISEGLAKEIEQLAKQNKISRSLAELLDVSKIMGESGKDPRTFSRQIGDLMNAIKSGAVPAAQGMEELGRAFNMVADAAVKSGTVGDRALVSLIKRARELGEVTPEMKAFVGAQLDNAVAGIHKYVSAIEQITKAAKATPEELSKIGATSGVVFGAMFDAMVSERGIVGAVDAMKDDYAKLHETLMSTLGPDAVNAILGPFGGAFATISDESLRPIFEGIDGITQAMTGLANAGYLSVDQFGAMQDATAQLFDQAVAGGADTRTALLAVAPGIQAAISAAEQFGVPLDADMARLKAMAEQNGITFKTDPQAAMLDVLVSIAQVLGAEVPESARRASAAMADLANSVPRNLDVNVNVHENRTSSGGGGGYGGGEGGGGEASPEPYVPYGSEPEFAEGGIMNASPTGEMAMLHGREAIVPLDRPSAIGSALSGGGDTAVTFNATFNVDPLQSNAAREDLAQFVINEFIRQARTSPMIRQLLRKDGGRG